MAFAAEQHQARTLALSNALARRDSRGTSAERRLERLAAERARPGAGAFLSNSLPRRVPHPRHTCECASSQAAAREMRRSFPRAFRRGWGGSYQGNNRRAHGLALLC
jgi:hypothetical protein